MLCLKCSWTHDESDYAMADRQKSISAWLPGVDKPSSDFNCLPEKMYGKTNFGTMRKKEGYDAKKYE